MQNERRRRLSSDPVESHEYQQRPPHLHKLLRDVPNAAIAQTQIVVPPACETSKKTEMALIEKPELRILGSEDIGMLATDESPAARQVETTMLQPTDSAATSWQFNGIRWLGAPEGVRTHSVSSMQDPTAMLTPGSDTYSVSYSCSQPMVAIFELHRPIRWAGLKVFLTGSLPHCLNVSLSH